DWAQVGATAGVFNPEKLLWMNQQWIKSTPATKLEDEVRRFLKERHGITEASQLADAIALMQERARTLIEIADGVAFLYRKEFQYDEAAAKKHLTPETRALLLEARGLIERRLADGSPALEAAFRDLATAKGLGLGKIAQPVRVAVTGTTVSPPLFDSMVLLGREKSLQRLDAALARIDRGGT